MVSTAQPLGAPRLVVAQGSRGCVACRPQRATGQRYRPQSLHLQGGGGLSFHLLRGQMLFQVSPPRCKEESSSKNWPGPGTRRGLTFLVQEPELWGSWMFTGPFSILASFCRGADIAPARGFLPRLLAKGCLRPLSSSCSLTPPCHPLQLGESPGTRHKAFTEGLTRAPSSPSWAP